MSTLIFRYEGDGHKPRVSPIGDLVGWGNTNLNIVHVANPAAIWHIGEGRYLRFLDNQRVTWIKILSASEAIRYADDLTMFAGGITQIDDTRLVAGNDFEAANGHWASVLIDGRRLAYDNKALKDVSARAVRMCGEYMLTVETIHGVEFFVVRQNGLAVNVHTLPPTANEFKINERGWITYGYYGPSYLMTPDGRSHQINLAPEEHVARIVHLPNGEVWAWSSTVMPNGQPLVIGRPLRLENNTWVSDVNCAQLPFPAEGVDAQWWQERQSFTVTGAANLGTTSPLEVHIVPHTHPRKQLVFFPSEPPEEDEVNSPGINVTDYARTIQSGVNTQIVHWKDRNNPGHEFKVHVINGSLKVEMTYDGWVTKFDRTGSPRPVTIKS